jgi:hypothetical protein
VAGWGKRQRGRASGGRASWRSGGAGRAARGQLAAREITGEGDGGRCSSETKREGREEDDEDLFIIF